MNSKAEFIRKKYLYRRLIMRRKISLHYKSAAGLIGPDCAYHLYGQIRASSQRPENDRVQSVAGIRRSDENEAGAS